MALTFFYNGIKGTDKVLQKCWYSDGRLQHAPKGTITIYNREYRRFSAEVKAEFEVHNDTESGTDYFDRDRIRVEPSHPLYAQVQEALGKQKAQRAKRNRSAEAV